MARKVIRALLIVVILFACGVWIRSQVGTGPEVRAQEVPTATPTPLPRRYFLSKMTGRVTILVPENLDSPLAGQRFAFTGVEIHEQALLGNTVVSIGSELFSMPIFKVVDVDKYGVWFVFLIDDVTFQFLRGWQTPL